MSDVSKTKSLAKDTGLFAISNFGSKILVFLLTPLYTSILTTSEYGIADLITTTINFIYPVLTLAIADATLRYALDKETDKKSVLCNSIILTIISALILLFLYPIIKAFSHELNQYWLVFVITYVLFNLHNCLSSFLKGIGKTALFAVQGIAQTIAIILCNLICLVGLQKGLDGYLFSIIVGYCVPIVIMLVFGDVFRFLFPFVLDKTLFIDMLKYSIPMVPTLLAWAANTSIDKYMIIGFVGLGASGIYSVAHKIPTIFTTVMSIFTQAWQISAIKNYGSNGEAEYHTRIYSGLNIFSLVGCTIIIISCKWVASFLFAKDFYEAWRYVPLLTVSAMFASHGGFLASAFRAAKETKSLFISVIAGTIVNIILNFFMIMRFGTIGAAYATAISFVITWLFRIILVQRIITVNINIKSTIISYIAFIAAAVLVTADVKNSIAYAVAALAVICIANAKDINDIIQGFMSVIGSIRKR